MTKISPKIVFFGTENYSLITLEALVEEGFNVVCVITKPDTKRGRGHKLTEPPVKTFAKPHNIPVLQPSKVSEITDYIKQLQPVTGVLVAYGKSFPSQLSTYLHRELSTSTLLYYQNIGDPRLSNQL